MRILCHSGCHLHDPRLLRLAEAHVGTVEQDSQGVLREISRYLIF